MTDRLYYTDSYLRDFTARVVDRSNDPTVVYLDRTAFYPTSGGQPFDLGSIGGAAVLEVSDEADGRIAHRVAAPIPAGPVACSIDWIRRFDHMQQHTGQHLLSAVFEELFHLRTVSFHLGADSSTIDVEGAPVNARVLAEVERRANQIVSENRPVEVRFEDAAEAQGLRKASDRQGALRIVSIDHLDRSACGGTHVRATGEIGAVLLRRTEKIRQATRVEFGCGARAVRRARADFEALTKTAQLFSAALDEVPAYVSGQLETARAGDKVRKKLELDLAAYLGRELYSKTPAGPDGIRRYTQELERGSLEELRAVSQNFTAQGKGVFVSALSDPPSILMATSADSGVDAGQLVKTALAAAGGRGGGNARMAQGSVPNLEALRAVLDKLISS